MDFRKTDVEGIIAVHLGEEGMSDWRKGGK